MRTKTPASLAEINVTPLIDVLLVLLIVFLLMAPLGRARLDAGLPQPARGQRSPDGDVPTLRVLAEGYSLDGQPATSLADLEARLRERVAGRAAPRVMVQAVARVPYGRVVAALDAAEAAGASAALLPRHEPRGAPQDDGARQRAHLDRDEIAIRPRRGRCLRPLAAAPAMPDQAELIRRADYR